MSNNQLPEKSKEKELIKEPLSETQTPSKEDTLTANDLLSSCNLELLLMEKINSSSQSKTCTYSQGYCSQEIFACLTCLKENNKPAVVCLGCSFKCHKDHELLCLYFKRNVRCDCGNSHFINECSLMKDKDYENLGNEYNHNYIGKYCYCDKEDDGTEMIQCFICEDWFHIEHVNLYKGKESLSKGEFICKNCIKDKIKFIFESYDIEKILPGDLSNQSPIKEQSSGSKKRKFNEAFPESNKSSCKMNRKEKYGILLKELIEHGNDIIISGEMLEKELCHCEKCEELYKEKKLNFLCGQCYTEWSKRILFEEKINNELDENSEENKKIISDIDNMNMYQTKEIRSLDVMKQTELSLMSKEFYEKFKEYIIEVSQREENKNKELTITREHIQEFLKKFQNSIH